MIVLVLLVCTSVLGGCILMVANSRLDQLTDGLGYPIPRWLAWVCGLGWALFAIPPILAMLWAQGALT